MSQLPARSFRQALFVLAVLLLGICLYLSIKVHYSFFLTSITKVPTNTDEALNVLMAKGIAAGQWPILFWTQPYQFPLEAYFLSLFVNWLPENAFGARGLLAMIASLALFGFSLTLIAHDKFKNIWPGLLLILLPSAYVVTRQVGYLIPQYTSTLTFAWLLPLLFVIDRRWPHFLWKIILGALSGLALSVHLLSTPFVGMIGMACCLGTNKNNAIKNSLFFIPAFIIGLLPYVAVLFMPDGYSKVTDTVPLSDLFKRIWQPILSAMISMATGTNPCVFPDFGFKYQEFVYLAPYFAYFYITCLILASFASIKSISNSLLHKKWPVLDIYHIAIGTSILNIVLAAASSFGDRARYLLPAAWFFPFLLTYVYSLFKNYIWRSIFVLVALGLAYVNYNTTLGIMRNWQRPGFNSGFPNLPHLAPLLTYLDEQKIKHCYASWWLVYRINFEADGQIECTQPYNERFPGWQLTSSHAEIEKLASTPFIALRHQHARLNSRLFAKLLNRNFITAEQNAFEHFMVYSNYQHISGQQLKLLDHEQFEVKSNSQVTPTSLLIDQNPTTLWQSDVKHRNNWLEFSFAKPTKLAAIKLHVSAKNFDLATPHLDIALLENDWLIAHQNFNGIPVRLKLDGAPRFISDQLIEITYGFSGSAIKGLRLEPARGHRRKLWSIGEVELLAIDDRL